MKWQRRLNIALTIALTTAFILLGILTFRQSYCRTFEALIDLYGGFKYYFRVLFDLPTSHKELRSREKSPDLNSFAKGWLIDPL